MSRPVIVTDIERVDVARADNGDTVASFTDDDTDLTTEVHLSPDAAEALQYALEQALR